MSLPRGALAAGLALAGARLALAAGTDLQGDEAFYWQCSRAPAVHYADHPCGTALLLRAGTAVLGDSSAGVRWPFVLAGLALAPALAALARPLVGARDAAWAGVLALLAPISMAVGMLATPDAPLLLLWLLALGRLLAARRDGRLADSLLFGAAGAAALLFHHRAALLAASAAAWLLLTRDGRARLRTPGPWCAAGVLLAGLVPVLWFNARLDWAPLRYQFVERHAGAADFGRPAAWLAEQALVLTPLLLIVLLVAAVRLVRRVRAGDGEAAALAALALTPLLAYGLGSPWADSERTDQHWPLSGWLLLLPWVPGLLRAGWRSARLTARAAVALVPALPAAIALLLPPAALAGWPRLPAARAPFAGWSELGERARELLPAASDALPPLVVADNYVPAAQLDRALAGAAEVFTLDHPRNVAHGRALQYALWGRDESALRARSGRRVLLVLEPTRVSPRRLPAWREHVAELFDQLQPLGELDVPEADARFELWSARVR